MDRIGESHEVSYQHISVKIFKTWRNKKIIRKRKKNNI